VLTGGRLRNMPIISSSRQPYIPCSQEQNCPMLNGMSAPSVLRGLRLTCGQVLRATAYPLPTFGPGITARMATADG
jgi:hypothetical protein